MRLKLKPDGKYLNNAILDILEVRTVLHGMSLHFLLVVGTPGLLERTPFAVLFAVIERTALCGTAGMR